MTVTATPSAILPGDICPSWCGDEHDVDRNGPPEDCRVRRGALLVPIVVGTRQHTTGSVDRNEYSPIVLRDWLRRRREDNARAEALRQELRDEYIDKLNARDPDALETARDYSDNDATPWRYEVAGGLAGLALIALMALVAVLILFFEGIKRLTGG